MKFRNRVGFIPPYFFCLQKLCWLRRHFLIGNNLIRFFCFQRAAWWTGLCPLPMVLMPLAHGFLWAAWQRQVTCPLAPTDVAALLCKTPVPGSRGPGLGAVTSHRASTFVFSATPPTPRVQGQPWQRNQPIHQRLLDSYMGSSSHLWETTLFPSKSRI